MRFSATGRGRMDDASFSTAINAAGHGKFQYAALAVAGLTYFTSGMQSGVNAYVLPSIRCSFQLTDSQMGILNAGFLIGGCFSAHLWGALSDSYGRRPVLVGTLLADAICILAASLAPTFPVFAVVRLLSGILNMAPAGLSFLYMGEFFPDVSRTKFSQALGSMWILSWISLSGLAWVVIPQPWSLEVLGLHMESWRFFLLMLLVPTLLAALSASLMPETPKFLQAAGREEEALVVYRRIYSTNTGKPPESYPVKRLHLPVLKKAVAIEEVSAAHPSTHGKGVLHLLGNTIKMSIELFRPPVLYRSLVCCGAYFCSMFVLYSFGYWLPELLNRYDQHSMTYPGVRATVCQVLSSGNSTASAQDDVVGATCADASNVSPAAFSQTLIVNSASASVNLFTTLSTRIIGRRSLAAGCNILSGLVGFGLLYVSSTVEVLSVATLFNALAETGCVAINALIIDIFPPRVSAVGVANVMLSGRLGGSVGNLAMGYLLEHSCQLPLILLFSTVIVCGLLCCFAHRRYEEDEEEGVAADTTPDSTPVQVAVIEVPAVKMTTALSPHAA